MSMEALFDARKRWYPDCWWERQDQAEIALKQTIEICASDTLMVEWEVYHEAMNAALGRHVQTIEFKNCLWLLAELQGKKSPPTRDEVLAMFPQEKLIVCDGERVVHSPGLN